VAGTGPGEAGGVKRESYFVVRKQENRGI